VRIEAIGRVQVQSVADSGSPFTSARVTYIDDVADDANDASEGAKEEATSSTLSLAALLVQEAEFWTCAERIVSQAVVLGLDPFRSKAGIEPPTLEDEIDPGKTGKAFLPPADSLSNPDKVDFYMSLLSKSLALASWPLTDVGNPATSVVAVSEEDALKRLRGVSFVGFELFESAPGVRQRALELQSTSQRFDSVIEKCQSRLQRLGAQLSLRKAFSSMPPEDDKK
jgi:hypothetical protein